MVDDLLDRMRDAAGVTAFGMAALTNEAADEIKRLRAALALAVGELSTHGEYTAWTPEMLMNQFLEEARRG